MKLPVVIDFETEAIDERRPHVPPKPVGVAIREPGQKSRYLAWGHPTENNCTRAEAREVLAFHWGITRARREEHPLLFHHAAFDLSVAEHHLDLPWPEADRIEDTMVLLWLADPYIPLGLKQAAETLCEMPPEEQEELRTWILAHVQEMKGKRKGWGAYISRAPGDLVGRYAIGDVDRTLALWKVLEPVRKSMPWRYRREMAVLRPAWRMTQRGIPLDVAGLERLLPEAEKRLAGMERRIRRALRAPGLDLGKRDAVADALEARGWVKPDAWGLTDKEGRRSTAVGDLGRVCLHPHFARIESTRPAGLWADYQLLSHTLSTFVRPWLERVEAGRLHVRWNTVAAYEEGQKRGAKTGRLSSNPNVQNISKQAPAEGLPWLRDYVKASRGMRLVCGDISQQEPRLCAHFAGGMAAAAYRANPRLDDHTATADLMLIPRGPAKTLNLASYYALGLEELARRLGVSIDEAAALRAAWRRARPDVHTLDMDLRRHWAKGGAIETWGGARVLCEPATGERTWEYRALNTLIQRSAAEQIKEAMIAWEEIEEEAEAPMVMTVHDEAVPECPTKRVPEVKRLLQEVLEGVGDLCGRPFAVPFVADVGAGTTWRRAKP